MRLVYFDGERATIAYPRRMNRLLLLVLAGALTFGCSRKTAPSEPAARAEAKAEPGAGAQPDSPPPPASDTEPNPLDWRTDSADGLTALEQKAKPDGTCTLKATRGEKTLWTGAACLGRRADMRFIANDGERVVVLHPVPKGSGGDWQHTEVAHVYRRTKLEWAVQAGAVIHDPRRARISGSSLEWLRGTLATPGPKPRYSEDGTSVKLETIEGDRQEIPLVPEDR